MATSKLPRILGVAIVLLLVLAVGGGIWYLRHSDTQASDTPASADGPPAAVIHLESFIVNLADQSQITYLRVSMDLGVDKAPDKKDGGAGVPIASIRDVIIGVLATRHSDELLTPEGKLKLKQDLISALNDRVPEIGVRDIYFTDFLVQR
ncbi:MAG TPA: flagellar basal body-associated FliL family protein [Candidatus Acidoferrales bacterium]|nr:flagellar basal body-associated FliL family protein [Candidatus Acidoferrales bacterium]